VADTTNSGNTSSNAAQSRDVVAEVRKAAIDGTCSLKSIDMIGGRQYALAAHGGCTDTSAQILAIEIFDFGLPIHIVEMSLK
jgi:hypothetical protein